MKITRFISQHTWTIGFSFEGIDSLLGNNDLNIKWLKNPYKNRWFADPFILEITDSVIELLVEEFYDPIFRGRISKLVIDRQKMSIIDCQPILQLETHLSFPFIFKENNEVYILPENYESGESKLYKYDKETNTCIYNRTLVKQPLMDAVLTNMFGEKHLFSTCYPSHDKLYVFTEDESNQQFSKDKEILFSENTARNAGAWFEYNGKCYRPAQDCNESYGKAIILQQVIKDKENYKFIDIRRIESSNPSYPLGCHTLDIHKGVMVFDAKAYRYPILRSLYQFVRGLIK